MKNIALLIFSFFIFKTYAQNSLPKYFGQCLFEISDESKIKELESELRTHPSLAVVRLDVYSKRAFILGKEGVVFTEAEFKSWFVEYSDSLKCIQIGVHGVDQVNSYPFKNCQ